MKLYAPTKGDRLITPEMIKRGEWALYVDVQCTECGKIQSAANAGSVSDGKCIKCGGRTA